MKMMGFVLGANAAGMAIYYISPPDGAQIAAVVAVLCISAGAIGAAIAEFFEDS